jgi:uncharacterized protein YdiU (UPF0061 family)
MNQAVEAMWASKLGLIRYDAELVNDLLQLMVRSEADYTIFFRRLSAIAAEPAAEIHEPLAALKESFYQPSSAELDGEWSQWLKRWCDQITANGDPHATAAAMQQLNPAITWREWLIAPAYEQAAQGDTSLIQELQAVFRHPYEALSPELAATYDRLKPREFFNAGGVSHYSCSS